MIEQECRCWCTSCRASSQITHHHVVICVFICVCITRHARNAMFLDQVSRRHRVLLLMAGWEMRRLCTRHRISEAVSSDRKACAHGTGLPWTEAAQCRAQT